MKNGTIGGVRAQTGETGSRKLTADGCPNNSRYYDAGIGRFISPDTIVPEWGR